MPSNTSHIQSFAKNLNIMWNQSMDRAKIRQSLSDANAQRKTGLVLCWDMSGD